MKRHRENTKMFKKYVVSMRTRSQLADNSNVALYDISFRTLVNDSPVIDSLESGTRERYTRESETTTLINLTKFLKVHFAE